MDDFLRMKMHDLVGTDTEVMHNAGRMSAGHVNVLYLHGCRAEGRPPNGWWQGTTRQPVASSPSCKGTHAFYSCNKLDCDKRTECERRVSPWIL
jgi:hypothetical protein